MRRKLDTLLKRTIDILLSATLLVISYPIGALVSIAIVMESGGPIFIIQERVGKDGKIFRVLKFSSMDKKAHTECPASHAHEKDERVTRVGYIIRKTAIDELPQLINVLIGDMSLVGPRPERPIFVEQFKETIPRYMDRHREKAGLTGWAQVNGLRGDTSIIERTKYDLWYTENWSLALDFRILIRTILNIFMDENAY